MTTIDTHPLRLSIAAGGLTLALIALWAVPATAGDHAWSVEVEPVYLDVLGHDRHVLTTREIDSGSAPLTAREKAVALDPDTTLGYRAAVRYTRARWSYGLDFLIHRTDHGIPPTRTTVGGAIDTVEFEVAGRAFGSSTEGDVLYHQTLEDTTIEIWTMDLYAARTLAEREGAAFEILLGLRNADFDNDYRAIAGLEGVAGVRIDASSNYSRMMGPLLGLAARIELGRHTLRADLRQSVVLGEAELSRTLRDFTGASAPFAAPPEEIPDGLTEERITTVQDIAVPMTDLRLQWGFALTRHLTLGASLGGSVWWDIAVPPGVVPATGPDALDENTLVFYGLGATVGYRF